MNVKKRPDETAFGLVSPNHTDYKRIISEARVEGLATGDNFWIGSAAMLYCKGEKPKCGYRSV